MRPLRVMFDRKWIQQMFFKEKRIERAIDVHCHILPAVDDGAKDERESLDMLRIAAAEGITDMIVTPHYKAWHRNASVETIQKRIQALQEAADRNHIRVSLHPGNEIFYFDELEERLEKNEVFSLNHTDRVLIEFTPTDDYTYLRNSLDQVRAMGYIPILAHAERYECLLRDSKRVRELKQLDVEIQINASSVVGKLGGKVQQFVCRILKEKLVDYIGTDAHDTEHRAPQVQQCYSKLYHKLETEYLHDIFYRNALKIIDAE